MEKFEVRGEFVELFKIIKILGWTDSGGQAKQAIAHGLVKVDGAVETRKTCKIRRGQKVEFEGHATIVE